MEFVERLRSAETINDFNALEDDFPMYNNSIFRDIFSPVVLRACLLHVDPSYDRLLKIFYFVAEHYRVDLLEVFFNGYLTLESLTVGIMGVKFSSFVARVLSHGYVDILKFLIEKGLDINRVDALERTYLSNAIINDKVDIMDLLLAKGADVNRTDSFGNTPVFLAMWSADVRILDRLIMHGANLLHRDNEGKTVWEAVPFMWYKKKMDPNFQRIADMSVPLEKKVYDKALRKSTLNPEMKDLLKIMHGVMKRQGFEVDDLENSEGAAE